MTNEKVARLVKDCRDAAASLRGTRTFPSGQSVLVEAAEVIAEMWDEINRLNLAGEEMAAKCRIAESAYEITRDEARAAHKERTK